MSPRIESGYAGWIRMHERLDSPSSFTSASRLSSFPTEADLLPGSMCIRLGARPSSSREGCSHRTRTCTLVLVRKSVGLSLNNRIIATTPRDSHNSQLAYLFAMDVGYTYFEGWCVHLWSLSRSVGQEQQLESWSLLPIIQPRTTDVSLSASNTGRLLTLRLSRQSLL